MRVPSFDLERWQSEWEHRVELNVAESGVLPLTVRELLELFPETGGLEALLATPLGYPQTNGSEELRARIASLYPGAGPANVLVTTGCAEANFLASWALLEPGDEVVFMHPNYMQIAGLVRGFGARLVPLGLREDLGWLPDLDELDRRMTGATRLVAVCHPNNPTGSVLGEAAIERLSAAAAGAGAWLLADEVYRGAELDGDSTPGFWGRYERVLCTGGLSKAYGLPGLRVGWIVGPPDTIAELWGRHDYTTIGPSAISDRLAAAALAPEVRPRILERTRGILRRNYPVIEEWVRRQAPHLRHVRPAAGASAWIGLPASIDTRALAESARREGVLLVPGDQFEMPGYVRIGFGGDLDQLRRAVGRVDALLGKGDRSI